MHSRTGAPWYEFIENAPERDAVGRAVATADDEELYPDLRAREATEPGRELQELRKRLSELEAR